MIIKEQILNELIKAFDFDECQEATTIQNDSDVAYEVDLNKKEDTITIVIERKQLKNKEKEEFERWLDTVDNDMFQEALEKVQEITGIDLQQLDRDYNSEDFGRIIKLFKDVVKVLAKTKIQNLQQYLK